MTTIGKMGITSNYQANSFAPVKKPGEKQNDLFHEIKEKKRKTEEYNAKKAEIKSQYENGEISKLEYYSQLIMLENPNKIEVNPCTFEATA